MEGLGIPGNYSEQYNAKAAMQQMDVRQTYRARLEAQKRDMDRRGAEIARALEILEKYPEIEELLTIVGRGL